MLESTRQSNILELNPSIAFYYWRNKIPTAPRYLTINIFSNKLFEPFSPFVILFLVVYKSITSQIAVIICYNEGDILMGESVDWLSR